MEVKLKKLSELKNWEKNPRGIKTQDFERLKNQIKNLGIYKPLLITEDGTVLGGNMRLRAYRELGITEVPVVVVDAPTESKKLEYALSDNDRAGYWEDQALAELLTTDGVGISFEDYKIDLGEPTDLSKLLEQFGPEIEEDEVPEVPEEPKSKLGEVYELGRHRLMCGDSTKIEDVEKLMGGVKADMVFTDPPYGVDFSGQKYNPRAKDWVGIEGDNQQGQDLIDFIYLVFSNLSTVSNEGTPLYCWSAPLLPGVEVLQGLLKTDWHIQSQLVWIKNTLVLGQADYQWRHEVCWYGYKGKHHTWLGGRDKTTVWEINKDANSSYEHPMQKPTALAATAIKNSSKGGSLILDVFGGSGSTLIACEQLNRTCYMMELDPKYTDVIRKRYQNFIEKQGENNAV